MPLSVDEEGILHRAFGGVGPRAIEQPTESFLGRAGAALGRGYRAIERAPGLAGYYYAGGPFRERALNPETPEETFEPEAIRELYTRPEAPPTSVLEGVKRGVVGEALTLAASPTNAVLMGGMGALPGAAKRVASVAFAAHMAPGAVERTKSAVRAIEQEGLSPRAAQVATEALLSTGFTLGALKHGLTRGQRAIERPFEEVTSRQEAAQRGPAQEMADRVIDEAATAEERGAAERAFLTPDRKAAADAEQARITREYLTGRSVSPAVRSMLSPGGEPRLVTPAGGPLITGPGAEAVRLSPAAAAVAGVASQPRAARAMELAANRARMARAEPPPAVVERPAEGMAPPLSTPEIVAPAGEGVAKAEIPKSRGLRRVPRPEEMTPEQLEALRDFEANSILYEGPERRLADLPFDIERRAPSRAAMQQELASQPPPTPAQAQAGNFAKGHLKWNGMDISVEVARGGERVAKDGSWRVQDFPADYGYVRRTKGKDGEQVDVYVGETPQSDRVFVIDQIDPRTGRFDEHKAMLGFTDEAAARDAYRRAFADGQGDQRAGAVTEMSADQFKAWVQTGETKKPLAYVPAEPAQTTAERPSTQRGQPAAVDTPSAPRPRTTEVLSTKELTTIYNTGLRPKDVDLMTVEQARGMIAPLLEHQANMRARAEAARQVEAPAAERRQPTAAEPAAAPAERPAAEPIVSDVQVEETLRASLPMLEGPKPRKGRPRPKELMGLDQRPELTGVGEKTMAKAIREDRDNPTYLKVKNAMQEEMAAAVENPPEYRYSVRPAPGQKGLPGIGEAVPAPAAKKAAPEQEQLFGKREMLQPSEARVTEGREREGPIFTQEAAAAAKADAAKQTTLPTRTADTMSEAIALSSPSGRMTARARTTANERLRENLFGKEGLQRPAAEQPSERESLLRKAGELRDLAARGQKPRAYTREAEALEARAAKFGTTSETATIPSGPIHPAVEPARLRVTADGQQWVVTSPQGRTLRVGKGTVANATAARDYAARYFNENRNEPVSPIDVVRQRFAKVAQIKDLPSGDGVELRFNDGSPGRLVVQEGAVSYRPGDVTTARPYLKDSAGYQVLGSFRKMDADGFIKLAEGTGGKILGHEELHGLLAMGRLRPPEVDALWREHGYDPYRQATRTIQAKLRDAGVPEGEIPTNREAAVKRLFSITEEKVADTVGKAINARLTAERAGKAIEQPGWFSRLWTNVKRLYEAFRGYRGATAESATERIASGEVYQKPGVLERAARRAGEALGTAAPPVSANVASEGAARLATAPAEPPPPPPRPVPKVAPEPTGQAEQRRAVAEAGKAESGRTEGKPPREFVNLDRIGVEGDVKRMESRVADALKDKLKNARSYRSWDQVRDKALEAGLSEQDFKRLVLERGAVTDVQIEAGRILREEAFKDAQAQLRELRKLKAEGKDTEGADVGYERAINRAAGVMWSTVRAGAEAGRALAIHRKLSEGLSEQEKLYRRVARERPGLSEEFAKRLLRTDPRDARALMDLVRAEYTPSRRSMAYEFWINGLLSGVPTHLANVTGNTVAQLLRIPERAMAAALDAARVAVKGGTRERFVGEAYADLMSIRGGLHKAVAAFRADWADQYGFKEGKIEHHLHAIPGKAGSIIRTPTRLLSATDEAFKAIAATREARAQAYRMARREGKSGAALATRIEDILGNLDAHPEIAKAMKGASEYETFTKQLGTFGTMAVSARDADPSGITKVIAPFMRTPLNIAKYTLERTPLNFIRLVDMFGPEMIAKKGNAQLAEELAKPILGTLMGVGFALAAKEGFITGGGPADDRERQNLRATGWQPYSFHVGDQYVSYQRLEPLSSIIGFAADMVEVGDEKKEGDLVNKIVGSIGENLTSKTFLQGVENFFTMWHDPVRYASQWAKGLEGSVVPTIFAKAAQAIDPTVRQTEATDLSAIAARIPGVSKLLEPQRRGTGEPIERGGSAFERFASPLTRSTEKGAEAALERDFNQIGFVPSRPGRTLTIRGKKIQLTDKEYNTFVAADKRATDYLRRLAARPGWGRVNSEAKRRAFEDAYRAANRMARARVIHGVLGRYRSEQRTAM